MPKPSFRFKQFTIQQDRCALKVGTDGILFGSWVEYAGASHILDIGTGTGVLAMIAAQRNATALIDAVEIDEASAAQAAENASASPWADRIRVHRMDVRRMRTTAPFDLIICNPPYYAGYSTSPDPRIGLAKHSEELLFPQLLEVVQRTLAPAGRFAVILPLNREVEMLQEAARIGLAPSRRCAVRYVPHRPAKRLLLDFTFTATQVQNTELTIEASGPFDYSPEYRALISDLMVGF
ncbi:MAG: methyltransferase [Flavobacteriales bacterium]